MWGGLQSWTLCSWCQRETSSEALSLRPNPPQMWRPAEGPLRTAALCLGLVLTHLVGEGGAVQVFSDPGQHVSLPCPYHYEDLAHLSQLSVQWRSPSGVLLCHFIKHKHFTNCSAGYAISYAPANITLHVLHAQAHDYGTHVCSVSKRHEFSDFKVELSRTTEAESSAPNGAQHSAPCRTFLLLHLLLLLLLLLLLSLTSFAPL